MGRKNWKDQKGSVAVIVGVLLIVLLGFVGLAVDVGNIYFFNGKMQSAVDAAARAGAYQFSSANPIPPSSTDQSMATQKANDILQSNGFSSVTLSPTFPTDAGSPAIKVTMTQEIPTYFMSLFGYPTVTRTVSAEAIAKIVGGTGGGGWGILEIGDGAVNVSGNVSVQGNVGVKGNGNVTLSGSCGVDGNLWVNGNGNVSLSGGGHSYPQGNYCVTGSLWDNGTGVFSMTGSAAVAGKGYSSSTSNDSFAWSTSINGVQAQGNGAQGLINNGVLSKDASGAVAAVQPYAEQAMTAYNDMISKSVTTNTTFLDWNGQPTTVTAINDNGAYHEPVKTIRGNGGENVLHLTDFNVSSDGTLTLTGTASDSFIIVVDNNFSMSGAGWVHVSGTLSPDNITWVHKGTQDVNLTAGTEFNGNILSPNGKINCSGNAQYYGSLVSGKDVTLSGSVHSPKNVSWLVPSSGGSGKKIQLINYNKN